MADLKTCFEAMGLGKVATVLQTGNVLFESASDDANALKEQIESGLSKAFNYSAKVQVIAAAELRKIIAAYPFAETDDTKHNYVIFLEADRAAQLLAEATGLDDTVEAVQLGAGVAYWQVNKGMTITSPFSKYLTKPAYKKLNTNRNIKTLRKISALVR